MDKLKLKNIIKSIINENEDNNIEIFSGSDYSIMDGINYRFKECGISTTSSFKNDKQIIYAKREDLPKILSVLTNSQNDIETVLAEKLKRKYLTK